MELLYVLLAGICLVLVWRGISLLMEWRSSLRLKIEPVPPGPDPDLMPNPELGKVRVVRRTEPVVTADQVGEAGLISAGPEQRIEAEGGAVPLAMAAVSSPMEAAGISAHEADAPVLVTPAVVDMGQKVAEQQDLFADEPIAPPPERRSTASRAQALYGDASSVEPVRPVTQEPPSGVPMEIEQVIALHVVCRDFPFNGEDLLRAVLSYGLRFGDMSIFHRHEQPSGQGKILFSMAKAVEPGMFDLESMTGEEIPGVSFFLALPGVNSIVAYDVMVDTARRLATELQGDVLDENQQPLTRQLVEHYRERVQEFERRRLMSRPGGR